MSIYTSFPSSWCVVPVVRSLYETAYGVKTHYVSCGEGDPIVLVHGGGPGASGATGWTHALPALSKKFRVYAPDLIGFGDSDKPTIEYSLQTFVEHIAGFIDALNLKAVRLAGVSQGAYIAIKYVLDNPGRVKSVALISTGSVATACGLEAAAQTATRTGKFTRYFDASSKEAVRSFLEMIVNDKSKISDELVELRYQNARKPGHREMMDSVSRNRKLATDDPTYRQLWSIRERLVALRTPCCIIWGQDDRTAPLDPLGYGLKDLLPQIPFHIVPNSGHQVENDQPEACNRILLEHFLAH